jgi:hypothetical protein
MIGYPISRLELAQLIDQQVPGWLSRARTRTGEFRKKRRFSEPNGSIWSEVKPIYMRLQGESKCAFCERKLEAEEYGKGEQAVEHFRPKGNVSNWRLPTRLANLGVTLTEAPKRKGGYYLLAYDLFNYSAACNPCNSALKRDYFPIAATHDLTGDSPEALIKEKPLLIYPIGDFDADPENLIRFNGISPYAAGRTDEEIRRAWITIEFFKLDSIKRDNLMLERARIITFLFAALERANDPNESRSSRASWNGLVTNFRSKKMPHTNCTNCFCELYLRDPAIAKEVFNVASDFIASKS